jgi:hypothetical protein
VSIREHTPAYASIRQHTSGILAGGIDQEALAEDPEGKVLVLRQLVNRYRAHQQHLHRGLAQQQV